MTLPLALSIGDPAGIGPELAAAAWCLRAAESLPHFFVVGSARLVEAAARRRGLNIPICAVKSPDEVAGCFADALPVLDIGDLDYTPGEPCDAGATLALDALSSATGLVRSGAASALITGPIAKSRLARIGFDYPGQTEYVAQACGISPENAVMMLAGPSLRVVPITVHVALRAVPDLLSTELIRNRAAITAAALTRDYGIANPRLAVAGLNPHAGEDGRMGREDADIVAPAVALLREAGINAFGPLPPDTMFHAEARKTYDVAICMYHDQALIPMKALDFDEGVNVTLGLPIIRTSPDHGTAFAIAGTGTARVGPTVAALRMAGECALRRAGL
ncbi:4-hydroxythreonine-4-phosphate dehydrogenase [Novosphingobium sp. AAP83]|uniref:4-hydroxythreonine-4-phosphate dehydrogenase PdxA n=1 Tax=Novosphingobium sp. AAP83 TaxID=1523425 RepID=UPI0006B8AD38|nr:4-hydroxythreonine-4-phosphate dehydrogenase PdxA [Novosphingobium sp. AAP83]KPF92219.1 4-hydroxythreonine-4-phosphate dehydrogenase [Novosphingobium sp. AAP83]